MDNWDYVKIPQPIVNMPENSNRLAVYVEEFTNKGLDDYEAILQAVNKAKELKAGRLIFEKKIYHLNSPLIDTAGAHIMLEGMKDITIEGNGAELQCRYLKSAIFIRDCERMVVKDIFIDWDVLMASPGRFEKGSDGMHLRIPEGWMGEDEVIGALAEYDLTARQWKMDGVELYYPRDVQCLDKGLFQSPDFSNFSDGMEVVVRHQLYGTTGINIYGVKTSDIILDSITIWQCPGIAFFLDKCGRGFQLLNCTIGLRENTNRLVSAASDGFHAIETSGDIIVEGCDFSHMGDDAINIHGSWRQILDYNENKFWIGLDYEKIKDHVDMIRSFPDKELILNALMPAYQDGDTLTFHTPDNLMLAGEGRVKKRRFEINEDILQSFIIVEMEEKLPKEISKGYYVGNKSRCNRNFIIRNNHFHNHRARGMLIQSPDGLVSNNIIENVMAAGIQVTTDCNYWNEGFGVQNLLIEGNILRGINKTHSASYCLDRHPAAINVVVDCKTKVGDWPLHKNILIKNNTVEDTPGLAVFTASAENVGIFGNRFIHTGYGLEMRSVISVVNAGNLSIENNVIQTGCNVDSDAINIDHDSTFDVTVRNNVIEK